MTYMFCLTKSKLWDFEKRIIIRSIHCGPVSYSSCWFILLPLLTNWFFFTSTHLQNVRGMQYTVQIEMFRTRRKLLLLFWVLFHFCHFAQCRSMLKMKKKFQPEVNSGMADILKSLSLKLSKSATSNKILGSDKIKKNDGVTGSPPPSANQGFWSIPENPEVNMTSVCFPEFLLYVRVIWLLSSYLCF